MSKEKLLKQKSMCLAKEVRYEYSMNDNPTDVISCGIWYMKLYTIWGETDRLRTILSLI
jgi:hypothetical protein